MQDPPPRPFYYQFAWAYDLLIAGPVTDRCAFITDTFSRRGVLPGAQILDAGCGTGNYTLELARGGYRVTGRDASIDLIAQARRKPASRSLRVRFELGDILNLPDTSGYDGILCRGVLNDLVDETSRRQVFRSFAAALRQQGVLILDVREWHATASRKTQQPVFEKSVETGSGKLTFYSVTQVENQTKQLLVSERHILEREGGTMVAEHDFVMRCWTKDELHLKLTSAGFDSHILGRLCSRLTLGRDGSDGCRRLSRAPSLQL